LIFKAGCWGANNWKIFHQQKQWLDAYDALKKASKESSHFDKS